MALKQAILKDLQRQVPDIPADVLPSLADRKAYVATQMDQISKMVYRALCDIQVAEEFATLKGEQENTTAQNSYQEAIAAFKGYLPTYRVLARLATELEAETE